MSGDVGTGAAPFWAEDPSGAAGEYVLGTLTADERAATEGRPGDLSGAERERLYARGLLLSLPKGPQILAATTPPR